MSWHTKPDSQAVVTRHRIDADAPWASQVQAVRPDAPTDLLVIAAPTVMSGRGSSLLLSFGTRQQRSPVSAEEIGQCATRLGAWSIGLRSRRERRPDAGP